MANFILDYDFKNTMAKGLFKPIIFCAPSTDIINQAVSLNVDLAQEISKIKPLRRSMRLEQCLRTVLEKYPDDVIIKDFDVLFNPTYKIDVLRMFISVCKVRSFSAIWPGTIDGAHLMYAEAGYADHKIYNLDDYDVTCVIWGGKKNEIL